MAPQLRLPPPPERRLPPPPPVADPRKSPGDGRRAAPGEPRRLPPPPPREKPAAAERPLQSTQDVFKEFIKQEKELLGGCHVPRVSIWCTGGTCPNGLHVRLTLCQSDMCADLCSIDLCQFHRHMHTCTWVSD